MSEVITPFRKEAMRKSIDLTVFAHPGLPARVKGDSARLRQIISNIMSNAFQNSVSGSIKVDIRCLCARPGRAKPGSSIVGITIQDAGMGMSEEQLDSLFQEFEQILDDDDTSMESSSSTPSVPGLKEPLGLGLAVVARYVRNMNGQIRVRSELGKGTIFGIEVPFDHAPTMPDSTKGSGNVIQRLSLDDCFAQNPADLHGMTATSPVSAGKMPIDQPGYFPRLSPASEETLRAPPITSSEEVLRDTIHFKTTSDFINSGIFPTGLQDLPIFSLSVLVAEDNPINARLLSRRLLKAGHKVEVACDGQACHDYFAAHSDTVDVILMDLQMPLVDGHESTRMIRSLEKDLKTLKVERPPVPIIAVSASLAEERRFDYVECG